MIPKETARERQRTWENDETCGKYVGKCVGKYIGKYINIYVKLCEHM
jgi:hypothetical protein